MKLIEYMPLFLKEVREFNEIFDVEDIELDVLKLAIEKLLKEIIVKTADGYGLERYERIYGISNVAESIEARRVNILFKMNNRIPYSFSWLVNMLDEMIGRENYVINLEYENYRLMINVLDYYKDIAKELEIVLRRQLPANMVLKVTIFLPEKMENKYIGGFVHVGDFIEIKQGV